MQKAKGGCMRQVLYSASTTLVFSRCSVNAGIQQVLLTYWLEKIHSTVIQQMLPQRPCIQQVLSKC